jgi:ABC-2 type transport system permease protein
VTATLTPTPTAAAPPRPRQQAGATRTLFADSLVFARRNLEHIRQIPEKLLDVTVQPLMFTLLFAFVFGGAIHVGGSYREYLVGGILVQSVAFGMMGPATSIATDLTEGVIDRFRSLPSSRAAYLLGHMMAELAGMVLAITILLGAGYLVGWRTHTDVLHVVEAIVLMILFAAAIIWVGTFLGMLVRSPDAVMGIGFTIIFPLTFMSSAFVPIASMPNWLQYVASWNPISSLVAAIRTLFGNPLAPVTKHIWPLEHPVGMAWIYTLVLLAIAVPLALHRYRVRTTD